jgi:hypothetical protein
MSDEKKGNTDRKKLVISKEALRKLVLEDDDLQRVKGGACPPPIVPGHPNENEQ